MSDTHIKINAVTPRVQYTGNGVTTTFPYEFAIFDETDMVVYVGDDIIESGYTVTGAGETEGGTVVFDTAPDDGVKITLLRNVPIERITDFQEGGTFRPKNLNDEFDRQTAFVQQVQEALSRCVKVDPTSESDPEEILPKVEELYDHIDNIDAVADDLSNIDTVAANVSDVGTCATNMAAILDAPTQATNAANSAIAADTSATAAAISAAGTHFKLFHHDWFDYELNDMAWLRADTFSWQDGTVYSDAYQHLVADVQGKEYISEIIEGHTIWYRLADDGHKIVTQASDYDGSANVNYIYEDTGVAWYYILDETNHRFKLPRENPAREELIQVIRAKGNGNTFGITDGLSTHALQANAMSGTAFNYLGASMTDSATVGTLSTQSKNWYNMGAPMLGVTTDSTKSGIISDMTESTSVFKGNRGLYFYVGQFTQTATEQTAGLNAELFNGKADTDLNNVSAGIDFVVESYQNGTDWYRLYKSGWVEQGGKYTATGSLTYLKIMADTNYNLTFSPHVNLDGQVYWSDFAFDKTTTGCKMRNTSPNTGDWEVKGMSAQS